MQAQNQPIITSRPPAMLPAAHEGHAREPRRKMPSAFRVSARVPPAAFTVTARLCVRPPTSRHTLWPVSWSPFQARKLESTEVMARPSARKQRLSRSWAQAGHLAIRPAAPVRALGVQSWGRGGPGNHLACTSGQPIRRGCSSRDSAPAGRGPPLGVMTPTPSAGEVAAFLLQRNP